MNPDLKTRLEHALRATLAPQQLEIVDDSAAHAGHGASGGHFTVHVISAAFTGMSRVARHRMVYDAVRPLLVADVHALSIRAQAPDESP